MGLSTIDPRRPLYSAARWMTAAGAIHRSFGGLFVIPALRAWPIAVASGVLIAGGIMFLICGSAARRHRPWAVWCGIAMGVLLGTVVAMLLALLVANIGWNDFVRLKSLAAVVMVLPLAAFVLVHLMIVWNLSNAFDGLREPPSMAARSIGFDPVLPIAPQPVLPIEVDDAAPPAAR